MNKLLLFFTILLSIFYCKNKTGINSKFNYNVVQDYALLFSQSEKDSLSNKIIDYQAASTNEICVYTLDSIPESLPVLKYATKIANELGIGKKDKDNGILILISKKDRKIGIATGNGTEKTITDSMCEIIITETIIPRFKNKEYYIGIDNAIDSIIKKWH